MLKNPEFLSQYTTRTGRLAHVLKTSDAEIKGYFDESTQYWNEIQEKLTKHGAKERMGPERLQILYACIRSLKPNIMVETGVAGGSTSYMILSAMQKNGKGDLTSIDIDNPIWHDHQNYQVGWLVTEELRKNWNLVIEDSKKELPVLVKSLKQIDIFFHDSDHSYEHMMFEFNTVWPFLSSDKIILADDINLNSSFVKFSSQHKLHFEKFYGFGVAKNKLTE